MSLRPREDSTPSRPPYADTTEFVDPRNAEFLIKNSILKGAYEMKEWKKRLLALTLCLVMAVSLAACGKNGDNSTNQPPPDTGNNSTNVEETKDPVETEPAFEVADNDEDIYFNSLSEFYDAYQLAMEADNDSERYALLAIAEAKALESAVGTPIYASAANWTMTRQVYRSGGYASWRGGLTDYSQMVLTNEIITAEDYNHLREMWRELLGTGTYAEKSVEYLTEKGYTFDDTFDRVFTVVPTTWDIHASANGNDTILARPTFDYLFYYDPEGELQPHLASGYEVSDDGLTYTIHIREGMNWVDSQGRVVAEITADDWVAAAQHRGDLQRTSSLDTYIAGMTAYRTGETTDFSTVGVKATDKYTLEYTLIKPIPYFMSMMVSNEYLPLCRSYFLSQGGAFGVAEYAEASASPGYTYGVDPNHIAYCGQFLCTNMTDKNSITFVLNEAYWNAENVPLKGVNIVYDSGGDITRSYTNFTNGNIVGLSLSTANLETAKANGDFDKYGVLSEVGRSTIALWFNLHRQTYANVADGAVPSQKTDLEKEVALAALQNVHFRRALVHSIDRATYLSISLGDDLKYVNIRNALTPGDFAMLKNDVTVPVNGKDTTFPAGTWYGAIVQAQLDADEFPVKVWDAENETTDGWDAWYNPELAAQELAIAIEELSALGYEVSKENPVVIDYPTMTYNEVSQNQGYVVKANIETTLDGLVRVDTLPIADYAEYANVLNNVNSGAEINYDMGGLSGIGSDYGDPQCYLEGMLPYGDGLMTMRMGMW